MNWDIYHMNQAYLAAMKSKDTSTKVGVVIIGEDHEILSTGFNGMPILVNDEIAERYQRPEKYFWFEHAERNAIYLAGRRGVPLYGTTMYSNVYPCPDCARAIIQVGIKELVIDKVWREAFAGTSLEDQAKRSTTMFTEACIKVREIEVKIVPIKKLLFGRIYNG